MNVNMFCMMMKKGLYVKHKLTTTTSGYSGLDCFLVNSFTTIKHKTQQLLWA